MRTPRPSNGCERVAGAARGHARRAGTQLGGDVGTASTTLARRLGTGWQVADLGTTTARLANSITAVDLSSLVLLDVAFAVTVAAIGVALFLLSGLAERRREFATLIAIGAEPRQVRSSMAGETLFIGVAGLATGLVIGGVVGFALLQILSGVFDPPADAPVIPLAPGWSPRTSAPPGAIAGSTASSSARQAPSESPSTASPLTTGSR